MDVAPHRHMVRRVRRRHVVPRENRPHQQDVGDRAPLLRRRTPQADRIFETPAAGGGGRDVVGGEAGDPLVHPARTVVERHVEADVFRRSRRAHVAAVPELLVDEHHGVQTIGLRVEPDALQLFVGRVALQLDDRLERALRQRAEVVRIADQQGAELGALGGNLGRRFDRANRVNRLWSLRRLIVLHHALFGASCALTGGKRRIRRLRTGSTGSGVRRVRQVLVRGFEGFEWFGGHGSAGHFRVRLTRELVTEPVELPNLSNENPVGPGASRTRRTWGQATPPAARNSWHDTPSTRPVIVHTFRSAPRPGPGGLLQEDPVIELLLFLTAALAMPQTSTAPPNPAIVSSEFIYDDRAVRRSATPRRSSRRRRGSWPRGSAATRERHPDVRIWVSRHVAGAWTAPVEVADGVQPDGTRLPTLESGALPAAHRAADALLQGRTVAQRRGGAWSSRPTDDGRTWSKPARLPDGILGPDQEQAGAARQTARSCRARAPSSDGWHVHMERSTDQGRTWQATPPLNDGKAIGAIQPTHPRPQERRAPGDRPHAQRQGLHDDVEGRRPTGIR